MGINKLPQELIDKIIGSIDRTRPDGYSALLACSRVSRSWQRQAQKELFPFVKFTSIDQLRRWDHNISRESEISSCVRRLFWGVSFGRIERPDPFLENTFPGRFASFSNLETLCLWNLSLRFFDNTTIEHTFGRIGHSLRHLSINHLTTEPEKWCSLVSLLPNLRFINISTVTMLEGDGGPGPNHPPSFNFAGHIEFYGHRTEQFFRCTAALRPRFDSLGVSDVDDTLVDTLNLVVQSCSATLTTLSIAPQVLEMEGNQSLSKLLFANPIMSAFMALSRLDLSPCSSLRALRIDSEMVGSPEFNILLQTISSKCFEKLTIGPCIPAYWNTIDKTFHSFAQRLYKLGATKPLTIVLELRPVDEARDIMPDIQCIWPLFCEVGVVVKDYSSG